MLKPLELCKIESAVQGNGCAKRGQQARMQLQDPRSAPHAGATCDVVPEGECSLWADGGAEEGQGLRMELQDAHAAPDARAPQAHRPVCAGAGDQGRIFDGRAERPEVPACHVLGLPVALLQHETRQTGCSPLRTLP